MKLIIGLGNPGKEYEKTRHNAGFILLNEIQKDFNFSEFKMEKKFDAEISEGNVAGEKIILCKPQTFMNLSGKTVRAILDFYKLSADDTIVIHDDLDIKLGTFKIATDSSSAGHNGVQNIIDVLGTQKFKRIRVGIGSATTDEPSCPPRLAETTACRREAGRLGAHNFVLGKFSDEELQETLSLLPEIKENL